MTFVTEGAISLKFGIRVKIIGLFSLVIVAGTAAMGTFASITMRGQISGAAEQKLTSDLKLAETIVDAKHAGNWSIKDGRLHKGNEVVTSLTGSLDTIAHASGAMVSIFQGSSRVATTLMNQDGRRAIGTPVPTDIANAVLHQGDTYIGPSTVIGVASIAAYAPIKDDTGTIVGMFGTAISKAPYSHMFDSFKKSSDRVWNRWFNGRYRCLLVGSQPIRSTIGSSNGRIDSCGIRRFNG